MPQGSSSRNGKAVRLIVVHTAEGAQNVGDLDAYFTRSQTGSSHAGVDKTTLVEGWVPYNRAAWTLRSGNAISDNLEVCAFAKWTRTQWLAQPKMLKLIAVWIASRCKARNIPCVKLSAADVRAGKSGVCGHIDWTEGMKDGSHWDPGPGFPWDVVMKQAQAILGGADTNEDDELNEVQAGQLADIHKWLKVEGQAYGLPLATHNEVGTVKTQVGELRAALAVPGAPYDWLPALNGKLDAVLALAANGAPASEVVDAAKSARAIADELAKLLNG